MGTKDKMWVRDAQRRRWLCKLVRVVDGDSRGEDWAEWLVHQLATIAGIPTATVVPATQAKRRGIVSLSFVAEGERLVHGNELLREVDSSYDEDEPGENPGYTVAAVSAALRTIAPPIGHPELALDSAFDVWAGYLMLDAWVAGRDRHHQNWAVIEAPSGYRRLAPSFDHGNALGFQEPAARARQIAASPDRLATWSQRGRSRHFAGRPGLVDIAREALDLADSSAAARWRNQLLAVSSTAVADLVDAVPSSVMSDAARTFCLALLEHNRRRLFDDH